MIFTSDLLPLLQDSLPKKQWPAAPRKEHTKSTAPPRASLASSPQQSSQEKEAPAQEPIPTLYKSGRDLTKAGMESPKDEPIPLYQSWYTSGNDDLLARRSRTASDTSSRNGRMWKELFIPAVGWYSQSSNTSGGCTYYSSEE